MFLENYELTKKENNNFERENKKRKEQKKGTKIKIEHKKRRRKRASSVLGALREATTIGCNAANRVFPAAWAGK
jgi:hypothetical protein